MIYGGLFDAPKKEKQIKKLDEIMKDDNFWNDRKKSKTIISEYNSLKKILETFNELKEEIEFHLNNLKNQAENDVLNFALEENEKIKTKLENFELEILLNEP